MKIKTIKQLLDFSNKQENECLPKIEIEPECLEQIKSLNKRVYDDFPLTDSERKDLRIIDNLLDRFKEENTALVCNGDILN